MKPCGVVYWENNVDITGKLSNYQKNTKYERERYVISLYIELLHQKLCPDQDVNRYTGIYYILISFLLWKWLAFMVM